MKDLETKKTDLPEVDDEITENIKATKKEDGKLQTKYFSIKQLRTIGKNEDGTFGGNGKDGWRVEEEPENVVSITEKVDGIQRPTTAPAEKTVEEVMEKLPDAPKEEEPKVIPSAKPKA